MPNSGPPRRPREWVPAYARENERSAARTSRTAPIVRSYSQRPKANANAQVAWSLGKDGSCEGAYPVALVFGVVAGLFAHSGVVARAAALVVAVVWIAVGRSR